LFYAESHGVVCDVMERKYPNFSHACSPS
jgi:hypothetical protein